MKRRDLERALESVPEFESPDPGREQYKTPAAIAADLVWAAWSDGDIKGKQVLDLGCGTGILAKAAELLDASEVMGVDVDEDALRIASDQVPGAHFDLDDVANWVPVHVDTILMNPPFGAQKSNRNADRVFLDQAMACKPSAIWLIAPTVSEKFLTSYFKEAKAEVEKVMEWQWPLQATMAHHKDAVRTIKVGGYRIVP